MVSPELLRKHAFFGFLTDAQYKAIAMIASEARFEKNADLLLADKQVDALYLLIEGSIDLYAVSEDKHDPQLRKEFLVGEVNPGEPFGLAAFTEPYLSVATVRTGAPCKAIKIDAAALRDLCKKDAKLGYAFARAVAKAALERLSYTQAQLAAARA